MHVCTVLINGICHRALRCISRFTLAPPGLCLALCFAPSVQLIPNTRRGCIRSHNTEAVVHFYPPLPYFSLPSLITLVTLLMLCLRSLYVIRGRRFYVARRRIVRFSPCYDTRYLIPRIHYRNYSGVVSYSACPYSDARVFPFFSLLFLAFNGNTFRCLCVMKKMRSARGWQSNGSCFEPIGWVHRWTIHFSISHSEASRSSLTNSASSRKNTRLLSSSDVRSSVQSYRSPDERRKQLFVPLTRSTTSLIQSRKKTQENLGNTHNALFFSRNTPGH